jgi:DNA-binding SARP family transcriptional activator/TolB-like protein
VKRASVLFLKTLGGLSVDMDGAPATGAAQRRKTLALLALLAASGRRGASRDKLIAYLWAESDAEHAHGLLKQACYALRRDLHAPDLFLGAVELRLNPDVLASDLAGFETALERGDLAAAVAAYAGPFLDGFYLSGAGEFERWVEATRTALKERVGDALETLATQAASADDFPAALKWWRRLTEVDPLSAQAALGLMRALNDAGERAEAVEHGRRYEAFVRQELGVEPAADVSALMLQLRKQTDVGVRQTRRASPPPSMTDAQAPQVPFGEPPRWPRRVVPAVVVAAGLVGTLAFAILTQRGGSAAPSSMAPRILVLPFQNLGAPQDAYFADGITDEITARLAMVRGLSVVGGQAARRYKGSDKAPAQMREETGADYVLEGTVSWQRDRSGPGRVRVRPQLINAHDESQTWAAVLDEDMNPTELFALLSGITRRVVDELHVALEAPQAQRLSAVPTGSVEAYDYYLRGRAFVRAAWSASNNRAAIDLLKRAVQRDSTFALAYAWLSVAHTNAEWLYSMGAHHFQEARDAAERAFKLDSELPDAYRALGHYYYACCQDYRRALLYLERGHTRQPGDAQMVMFIGNVHKRTGRWDDAIRYYEEAVRLDPGWQTPLLNLSQAQLWIRRYEDAERTSRRALALEPRDAFAYTIWASVPLLRAGDLVAARRIVQEAAAVSDGYDGMRLPFYLELLERRYDAAVRRLSNKLGPVETGDDWLVNDQIRKAVVSRLLGDSTGARAHFDSARIELDQRLVDFAQSAQMQNWLRSGLAICYAGLGRRAAALEEARRVLAADPLTVDAISGPAVLQDVALTYVILGERLAALEVLERLLYTPARFSAHLLRLDPLWDPLRGDPRFERLVQGAR